MYEKHWHIHLKGVKYQIAASYLNRYTDDNFATIACTIYINRDNP